MDRGCVTNNKFSYFYTNTYIVGTQKNRFNETVLPGTQNICSDWWIRKYQQFYTKILFTRGPGNDWFTSPYCELNMFIYHLKNTQNLLTELT